LGAAVRATPQAGQKCIVGTRRWHSLQGAGGPTLCSATEPNSPPWMQARVQTIRTAAATAQATTFNNNEPA
jgi:hypothetical protein